MNRENMLKVADAIEKRQVASRPIGFNMYSYIHDNNAGIAKDANGASCGTTACVAGFVTMIAQVEMMKSIKGKHSHENGLTPLHSHEIATKYLGLTPLQADSLFLDAVDTFHENHPLVPDALRWMAMTGKVSWKKAIKASACLHKVEARIYE